jgi:hypothetical protein
VEESAMVHEESTVYIMALSSSDPQMAINLSMKQGSLFCFVVMRSTEPQDASDCVLGVFGKLSTNAWAWFHDVWTCSAKVLEY